MNVFAWIYARAVAIWRFHQEWSFHAERIETDYKASGISSSEARRLTRKRMGSRFRHMKNALSNLLSERASETPWRFKRCTYSPFFRPMLLIAMNAVLLAGNPMRAAVFKSIRRAIETGASFVLANPGPLFLDLAQMRRSYVVPAELPLAAACLVLAIGSGFILLDWRQKLNSPKKLLYASVALVLLAFLDMVVGTTVLQIWAVTPLPEAPRGWSLLCLSLLYLWTNSQALSIWRWDVLHRCPFCLQQLRLPLSSGQTFHVLVDLESEESVCIYGHGSLTETRWTTEFRPAESSLWLDLLSSSSGSQR